MTVEDLANAICFPGAVVEEHLDEFEQAGLVCSRDDGGTVAYEVDYHATSELWGFLMANCCPDNFNQGHVVACS
jgi:DNA-binding transcriptional ArsR family regulator